AWNGQQKLDEELKAIGFYFSGHPLDDVLSSVDRDRVTLAMEIEGRAEDGKPLELIGIVRRRAEKPARNGGKFAFLTLSDPSGEVELMVFPETLSANREQLEPGAPVAITAAVKRNGEEIRLNAERVKPLAAARISKGSSSLTVRLGIGAEPGDLAAIAATLKTAPGAERGEIYVEIPLEDGRIVMLKLPDTYATNLQALQALKSASGVDQVASRAA
ncbi:MAG: OB-fold nucleic acid binding domain-containing protein, partial [Pseudomonadota bacterium]